MLPLRLDCNLGNSLELTDSKGFLCICRGQQVSDQLCIAQCALLILHMPCNPYRTFLTDATSVQLDSILEEGPELEHRGLATSSVQRLARMNAKRSMSAASSAASSSAGSSGSPRAVPSTHLRKGSTLN